VEGRAVCLGDDDLAVLNSMEFLLASDGYKVRPVNQPEEFLKYAASHHVPLGVLDVWMEKVTGLEVLARLCALSPRSRVMVITARELVAARATAMAIGRVAYCMKPFNDEKFLAAVHKALESPPS